MKKIIITLSILLIFGISGVSAISFGQKDCQFNGSIQGSLDGCLDDSTLVDATGPTLIEGNVKIQVITWTNALAAFLGLLAVGAIVYGGLLMTLSFGDEEKIKKGKDIVKWALIGFLALITAGAFIRLIVELIFGLAA